MAGLKAGLRVLLEFWKGFRLLPSAQLVLLQFFYTDFIFAQQ